MIKYIILCLFLGLITIGYTQTKVDSKTSEELLKSSIEYYENSKYDEALNLIQIGLKRNDEKRINFLHLKYNILKDQNKKKKLVITAIDLAEYYTSSPKKARDVSHIYLKLNDANNALVWLEKTVDRGFMDISDLEKNSIYNPIRSSPKFTELVLKVKSSVGLNQPAKEIKGTTIEGKKIDLSDYKGKVVLIDFWALYCPPCIKEIKNFLQYYPELSKESFEILSINLDEDKSKVIQFIEEKHIDWPVLFSDKGWKDDNRVEYELQNIPSYWLVDKEGILRFVGLEGKELEEAIRSLINE